MNRSIRETLDSPCTSTWLKDALRSALRRDCVDASHDAEVLAMLLSARADEMLGKPIRVRTAAITAAQRTEALCTSQTTSTPGRYSWPLPCSSRG